MSINIDKDLKELKNIKDDISDRKKAIKNLQKRECILKKSIINVLKTNNHPGIKNEEVVAMLKTNTCRRRKPQKDAESQEIEILKNMGVSDYLNVYAKLKVARKGEEYEKEDLKLKDVKKK